MQWEYAWTWVNNSEDCTIRYTHRQEEKLSRVKSLGMTVVKRLGDEGWELLAVVHDVVLPDVYWFKRPRSQQ